MSNGSTTVKRTSSIYNPKAKFVVGDESIQLSAMTKSRLPMHGYDTYFLKKKVYINIGKHKMMVCKSASNSLVIFDVDDNMKSMLMSHCENVLNEFPSYEHHIPFNMGDSSVFLHTDKCVTFMVDQNGLYRKELPPPGQVFTGKVSVVLHGVKVKNDQASPMIKADQVLVINYGGNDEYQDVECRLSLDDDDDM